MSIAAPLQVTVEIALGSGAAAGQRRFRLSRQLLLSPPRLAFDGALPVAGEAPGACRFWLPSPAGQQDRPDAGRLIACDARLRFDPERPGQGSQAELLGLAATQLEALESYIEQRMRS